MSARRRHVGSRENPEEGTCLGVFGLSLYTTERELDKEFSKFGPLQKVQVVLDGKVINININLITNMLHRFKPAELSYRKLSLLRI